MAWGVALTARWAAITAVLVVALGCAPIPRPTATPVRATPARKAPARIGAILSLTGLGADRGRQQYNGLTLAIDELNRDRAAPAPLLQLVALDDNSSRDRLRTQFDTLVNQQQVVAVLGPSLPGLARVLAPACQEASVPMLALVGDLRGLTETGDYVFSDSLVDALVIPQTVKAAVDAQHVKSAGLLFDSGDAFTRMEAGVFKEALQQNGVQIVAEESFGRGEKDVSNQLTAIKAAAPQAVFISALSGEAGGILVQARRLGLNQLVVGGSGFNSSGLVTDAGQAAEGVMVGSAWNPASPNASSQAFISSYRARYNAEPDQFAAQAYAGAYILAEGLRNARTSGDRRALRDGLASIKDFDTVLGRFGFSPDGAPSHQASILVVSGGQFRLVP